MFLLWEVFSGCPMLVQVIWMSQSSSDSMSYEYSGCPSALVVPYRPELSECPGAMLFQVILMSQSSSGTMSVQTSVNIDGIMIILYLFVNFFSSSVQTNGSQYIHIYIDHIKVSLEECAVSKVETIQQCVIRDYRVYNSNGCN